MQTSSSRLSLLMLSVTVTVTVVVAVSLGGAQLVGALQAAQHLEPADALPLYAALAEALGA